MSYFSVLKKPADRAGGTEKDGQFRWNHQLIKSGDADLYALDHSQFIIYHECWAGKREDIKMNMNDFSLKGKVAWITGASYGIGFAIAEAYAAAGAVIVFNDISQELVDRGLKKVFLRSFLR